MASLCRYLVIQKWPHTEFYHYQNLTHWGWDKFATISQMSFSNAFSGMKMYKFCVRFHWSLLLRFELMIFQYWFRWWLGVDQVTSHYLNQWWLVYWCMYASPSFNELTASYPPLFWAVRNDLEATIIIASTMNIAHSGHLEMNRFVIVFTGLKFNSLWPSDAIWWHISGSTLVQVMACCLKAPSHYLNQCWLYFSKVL